MVTRKKSDQAKRQAARLAKETGTETDPAELVYVVALLVLVLVLFAVEGPLRVPVDQAQEGLQDLRQDPEAEHPWPETRPEQ